LNSTFPGQPGIILGFYQNDASGCSLFFSFLEQHIIHMRSPQIKVKVANSGHACCAGTGEGWLVPYRGHRRDDRGGLPAHHRQKEEHLQAGTR